MDRLDERERLGSQGDRAVWVTLAPQVPQDSQGPVARPDRRDSLADRVSMDQVGAQAAQDLRDRLVRLVGGVAMGSKDVLAVPVLLDHQVII